MARQLSTDTTTIAIDTRYEFFYDSQSYLLYSWGLRDPIAGSRANDQSCSSHNSHFQPPVRSTTSSPPPKLPTVSTNFRANAAVYRVDHAPNVHLLSTKPVDRYVILLDSRKSFGTTRTKSSALPTHRKASSDRKHYLRINSVDLLHYCEHTSYCSQPDSIPSSSQRTYLLLQVSRSPLSPFLPPSRRSLQWIKPMPAAVHQKPVSFHSIRANFIGVGPGGKDSPHIRYTSNLSEHWISST